MLKISASESVPGGTTSPLPGNVLGVQILKSHCKPKASQVAVVVKKHACQCRRHERPGFDPWVGKIPWRREWQPTEVFLPGESHG